MADFPYHLRPVCHIHMESEIPAEVIGPTPAGLRANFFISRGEVRGERIRGIVRPQGCADWALIRPDDVVEADVRLTIETHDAALIYVTYTGLALLGSGGSEKLKNGRPLASVVPIRIAARMASGNPAYRWVNGAQFLGVGATHTDPITIVDYDIYELA